MSQEASDEESGVSELEGEGKDDCDEAWNYVEFLKKDISGPVEDILRKTLYRAQERQGLIVLEETVTTTMNQVMNIRENLLKRISDIRKEEICKSQKQNVRQERALSRLRKNIMEILLKLVSKESASISMLRSIGSDIFRFNSLVEQEIMRMLTLPQQSKIEQPSNCEECDGLGQLSFTVENIFVCANKKTKNDLMNNGDVKAIGKPGDNCKPASMYSMDLITVTEMIDTEVDKLYNKLITAIKGDSRKEFFQNLDYYKVLRSDIDNIITKLTLSEGDGNARTIIKRYIRSINSELKSKLKKCEQKCDPDGCESCAAQFIFEAIEKMNDYRALFGNTDDDILMKEFVRNDMIRFINDNNEESRNILIKKAQDGALNNCNAEKFEILNMSRGPMWMLVNTTIFSTGTSELEFMVDAMVEQLETLIDKYCKSDVSVRIGGGDGSNCDWEEYEATKKYLVKIDDIIHDALYKTPDESKLITALLGFVDIQGLLDARVKRLFEEGMVCPDEVMVVKQIYMKQLNLCMEQLMNPRLTFTRLNRSQRMSCTNNLRDKIDDRMVTLLQNEVEKGLSDLQRG